MFFVITQSLLVPAQIATFIKLMKGGNNKKAIKLTFMFLLSASIQISIAVGCRITQPKALR